MPDLGTIQCEGRRRSTLPWVIVGLPYRYATYTEAALALLSMTEPNDSY